ncbi:MAG: hypothetical protein A2086_03035 [Spirochaetes bacterium GWD1_27_9]|nr:MAG: hypothetical protein A2Z98_14000 [Spirochaetes bacterium GWB1_27_13]OHD27409.1 MAG: hypothetical protein A2Y34_10615 [Spirochaetes bacterium GWC1_27_15]OHD31360.1 MAG: hypothetical protein A2086_03035 [Spirochaetes bacterium GWD1_27_9]
MDIPVDLKHKPVIVSDNYDVVDGRYANSSDAKGLSLGLAQWNERGKVEISAKIWRHTGEKWSRQSEEMPLHRVLDLAILICKTKLYFSNLYHTDKKDFPNYPQIDRIGLQGNAMNVAVCEANEHIEEDIKLFDSCLHQDDEILSERLKILSDLLKKMSY